jgi:release factor glutamine methyltransferase
MTPPETIGSTLGAAAAELAAAGFDETRRRARRLVAAALDVSTSEVFANLDRMIPAADSERIAELLARMVAHEPLSRILGVREFWGLDFALSPDTLDPRPQSETIVEAVLARHADRERAYRILDLGTGSGCLLLALLSELPAATGVGIDVSSGAIATARDNAARLGLAARAEFVTGDWAEGLTETFDVVVANPPYIATADIAGLPLEVRDFDPRRALDGGADGLDAYRAIAAAVPRLLKLGGVFAGEFGRGQDAAVAAAIASGGLIVDNVVPDLAGIPRCVVARRAGSEKMVGTGEPPA